MTGIAALLAFKATPVFAAYQTKAASGTNTLVMFDPAGGSLIVGIFGAVNATPVTWTLPLGGGKRLDQGAAPCICVGTELPSTPIWETSDVVDNLFGIELGFNAAIYDTIGSVQTAVADGVLTIPGITSQGGLALIAVLAENGCTVSEPADFGTIYNGTLGGSRLAVFSKQIYPGATGDGAVVIAGLSGTAAGVMIGLK